MQLASMNAPTRRASSAHQPSVDQVAANLDRLKEKLAKLDEELGMIKTRKRSVDADCRVLLELLESKSVNSPGPVVSRSSSRRNGSTSIVDESDIKLMLMRDLALEDIDL
jgi:hypothetical protein